MPLLAARRTYSGASSFTGKRDAPRQCLSRAVPDDAGKRATGLEFARLPCHPLLPQPCRAARCHNVADGSDRLARCCCCRCRSAPALLLALLKLKLASLAIGTLATDRARMRRRRLLLEPERAGRGCIEVHMPPTSAPSRSPSAQSRVSRSWVTGSSTSRGRLLAAARRLRRLLVAPAPGRTETAASPARSCRHRPSPACRRAVEGCCEGGGSGVAAGRLRQQGGRGSFATSRPAYRARRPWARRGRVGRESTTRVPMEWATYGVHHRVVQTPPPRRRR
jgi:hypothetical protein